MVYIWFIYGWYIYICIIFILYILLYIYILYYIYIYYIYIYIKYNIYIYIIYILVGGFNQPLWKMMEWTSDGIMKFPTEWKVIKHVPNHQPEPEFVCDSTDFQICLFVSLRLQEDTESCLRSRMSGQIESFAQCDVSPSGKKLWYHILYWQDISIQSIIYRCGSRPRSKHLLQFLTDAESGLGTFPQSPWSELQCGDREDGMAGIVNQG